MNSIMVEIVYAHHADGIVDGRLDADPAAWIRRRVWAATPATIRDRFEMLTPVM